ncbi:MAG: RNA-directed DNA polymerase [Planctomycetales bacterium]|nr:RNA-directed DNA polymerase [Planctomycetales bacterium]
MARFILSDRGFLRAYERHNLQLVELLTTAPVMLPLPTAEGWEVPQLPEVNDLADWLGVSLATLHWLADTRCLESKWNRGKLRNYYYRPLAKKQGTIRLIEVPKPRLKGCQRQILTGILDHIPPHDAAHGFCRGRSIKSFADKHVGKQVVLRLDLQDFFPSVHGGRVQAVFRSLGFPASVADLLAGICTNSTPRDIWESLQFPQPQLRLTQWQYDNVHLPQGAPTSPALANLCAYRLDCRLSALARTVGADYTRYADDLAFSGGQDFSRAVRRFHVHASAIAMDEGFHVHFRKTRIMRRSARQRLAGLVVNQHANISRAEYDRLKATLHNCVRSGPSDQNRTGHTDFRAYLNGRISFIEMVNPARGAHLRRLFDRIPW